MNDIPMMGIVGFITVILLCIALGMGLDRVQNFATALTNPSTKTAQTEPASAP